MRNLYKISLVILVAVLITSCASAYKSFKKGDYYKATIDAVDKLRSSPTNDKAQYVLTKAYPLAQKTALREIENAKLRNDQNNFEIIVNQYEKLNKMAADIYACPKAYEIIPNPTEYHAELADARNIAASQVYEMGLKALSTNNFTQARIANKYFIQANQYVNGYKDVLKMIEESRYQSTLRVAVEKPRTSMNYQLSADFFSDNLIADITKTLENRLIRFYNFTEYSNNTSIQPHQYLVLNFEDFTVGNVFDSKSSIELKRDSVIVGTATIQGKKVDVYNTVKATLNTYRREIKSKGILSVKIFDNNNQLIQQRTFAGEYVWYTTWANYNGDDRALTTAQKNECNQSPQIPPTPQQMFVEFTKPIYSQAYTYIRTYFYKY